MTSPAPAPHDDAPVAVDASAAPRRERGMRTRAGNAMERTRAAVLDGASRAVEKYGARKATMGDIAMLAGIAKGTLYNHFRDKSAVYSAAIDTGVTSLADECRVVAADDLGEALALAAERIGGNAALRRVAADEPAVLAALMTPAETPVWRAARVAVRDVLVAAGREGDVPSVDLVLRWLVSFVADAGREVETQARLLAAAIRAPVPATSPAYAGAQGT